MALRRSLSARAAESRYLIREELAAFRLVQDVRPHGSRMRLRPRRHLPEPVIVLPAERAAQNGMVRIVSITEAFVFGRLLDVTEPRLPADALVGLLWEREVDNAITWDGRLKSWFRLHKVNLESSSVYRDFRTFVDARNSITHGLGRLTWHQLRGKRDVANEFRAVGIDVLHDRLVLSSASIEACALRGVELIRWLDGAVAEP